MFLTFKNRFIQNQPFSWMIFSIGLVYLWFGVLKFFPNISPAEELATETISLLSFGVLHGRIGLELLAVLELIIGFTFAFGLLRKWNIWLAILHIVGTFLPFLLLPDRCFGEQALQFTLVGQYIFKNILFLAFFLILLNAVNKKTAVKTG